MAKKKQSKRRNKSNRERNKKTNQGTKTTNTVRESGPAAERKKQKEDAKHRIDPKSRYYQDIIQRSKELNIFIDSKHPMDISIDNLIFLLYEYGYRITHLENIVYQLLYVDSLTDKLQNLETGDGDV